MSKARDVVYGRRAGRWADGDAQADVFLKDLHRIRLRAIRQGDVAVKNDAGRIVRHQAAWPQDSIELWRPLAVRAHLALTAGVRRENLDMELERALEVEEAALSVGRW